METMDRPEVNDSSSVSCNQTSPCNVTNTRLCNATGDASSIEYLTTHIVFLLFLVAGFIANIILIANVVYRQRQHARPVNVFILSLALANIIFCAGNIPQLVFSSVQNHDRWMFDDGVACEVDALVVYLVTTETVWTLLLMVVDRLVALGSSPDTDRFKMTLFRARGLIVISWSSAVVLNIPLIVLDVVKIQRLQSTTYICTVASADNLAYMWTVTVLGYLIPFGFIVLLYSAIIVASIRERQAAALAYSAAVSTENRPRTWKEISTAQYVAILIGMWCLFQLPFLLLTFVRTLSNPLTLETIDEFCYPQQLGAFFGWLFLSYPLVLPLLTFCWEKEAWQRLKTYVLCRKANVVVDSTPTRTPDHRKPDPVVPPPTSIPVLYATEHGLHIRTSCGPPKRREDIIRDDADAESFKKDKNPNTVVTIVAKKCDVFGSLYSDDFLQMDTSDYDSSGELDSCSNSNGFTETVLHRNQGITSASQKSKSITGLVPATAVQVVRAVTVDDNRNEIVDKNVEIKTGNECGSVVFECQQIEIPLDPKLLRCSKHGDLMECNSAGCHLDSGNASLQAKQKKKKKREKQRHSSEPNGNSHWYVEAQSENEVTRVEIPNEIMNTDDKPTSNNHSTQNGQPNNGRKKKKKHPTIQALPSDEISKKRPRQIAPLDIKNQGHDPRKTDVASTAEETDNTLGSCKIIRLGGCGENVHLTSKGIKAVNATREIPISQNRKRLTSDSRTVLLDSSNGSTASTVFQ